MSPETQNNGMTTSTWGPVGWVYLHSVSFGYPVSPSEFDSSNGNPVGTTENNFRMFFKYVGKTLPCKYCRESYDKFFAELPIRLESRETLTRWLWEIHNKVNNKLDAEYHDSDFESVTRKYESFRAKCTHTPETKGCTEPVKNETKKVCKVVVRPVSSMVCPYAVSKITTILVGFFVLFVIFMRKRNR